MSPPAITNQPSKNNVDNDICSFQTLLISPCNCSRQACSMGCDGCNQWEKHSGNDCKEMLFCCFPITFVFDTIVFPYTMIKFIVQKCKT
jgi:hypothetical protein